MADAASVGRFPVAAACSASLFDSEALAVSMRIRIFQVDAFTSQRFGGNPAAVMPMESFLEDSVLQSIAAENNLAETAFLVREANDYQIRWFTPTVEVPLCGHATLASAAVVMERLEPQRKQVTFHSASGPLRVFKSAQGYVMDFPARFTRTCAVPVGLSEAIGVVPIEVSEDQFNYLVLVEGSKIVRNLAPDIPAIARLNRSGVVVTAEGDGDYDFVSRYFAPAKGIPEDPVTGGAHCALTPYWAKRLNKFHFRAFQASRRGGEIDCRLIGDRVEMEGPCIFYLDGEVEV